MKRNDSATATMDGRVSGATWMSSARLSARTPHRAATGSYAKSTRVRNCVLDKLTRIVLNDSMKTMTVGEFKARFSEVLEAVKKGQEIAVSYGKSRKPIGVFKPFDPGVKKRKLGILKGKASFIVKGDFKITEQELLG